MSASHGNPDKPRGTCSFNWRNPPASHLSKYNLRALPGDFEPTEEEFQLLSMYEVIQQHERVAARLKEEAARAKLAARDAEFQQQKLGQTSSTASKRNRPQKKTKRGDEDDSDLEDKDILYSDDDIEDEDDEETLRDSREAKLAKLREEVEEAKRSIVPLGQQEVDALRQQHLTTSDNVDSGPVILKKRKDFETDTTGAAPSSLIANLTGSTTPPHDFSQKLDLATRGKILFPSDTTTFKWMPPEGMFTPNDGSFQVDLPEFDVARAQTGMGNNTVAIKVSSEVLKVFFVDSLTYAFLTCTPRSFGSCVDI
jgi:hypothetical protein